MGIKLYRHQIQALNKLRNGSILCGGVGSGKSRTALAYYYEKVCKGSLRINNIGKDLPMAHPLPLYIITTARKRDTKEWEYEAAIFGIGHKDSSDMVQYDMVVDSWNNIEKYVNVSGAFFIFDEQRVVGSGAWSKGFITIARKNKWILLSATPGDTWMDYASVFIAKGYFRNKTEFLKKHVVFKRFVTYPKVERYINEAQLEKYRKETVVDMFMKRQVKYRHIDVIVDYDQDLMKRIVEQRWDIFKNKPLLDAAAYCAAMRRLVNSDKSRVARVVEIVKKHKTAIVFYNFDYELLALREALTTLSIPFSEWNGHKHESILKSDCWVYLVQYTAGAEGWNCVQTNVIIFFSQNYSYKVMTQAAGRIDRLNTPYDTLYYYHLKSKSKIDSDIAAALKRKENFNEKRLYGTLFEQ